jgi:hypothetical protein
MLTSVAAWFMMLVWIAAGAKSAPLIARAVTPAVRPLGPPARMIARHVRLPLACVFAFAAFVVAGFVLGLAYATLLVEQPRTCAQVETAVGSIYTCEIGHPYHELIVRSEP